MARGKGGGYDLVLETRHLLGIFFAAVLLCALFFTLGFVVGRNQERAATRSAALKARTATEPSSAVQSKTPADSPAPPLGFYERVDEPKPSLPAPRTDTPKPSPKPPTKPPAESASPQILAATSAKGAVFLQMAALTRKDDAERLRQELRRLGFPALIVPPSTDRFYRVQVGPFSDPELAAAAQRRLEARGFSVLVKR